MTRFAFRTLSGVALLALATCNQPPPNAGRPTEQGQSMARMLANVDTIRAYTTGSANQSDAEAAATELVAWSGRLPELFPPAVTKSYVDLTPAMVQSGSQTIRRWGEQLQATIASGNQAAAHQALAALDVDGCGTCHRHSYH